MREYLTCNIKTELNIKRPLASSLTRTFLFLYNLFFFRNASSDNRSLCATVQVRHTALERNKRCLLAYLYSRMNKIKTLRWEFGSVLPPDVRELLSDDEYQWFSKYSTNLASYMRSLGSDIGYTGIDLTENLKPPKSLYIEVLCMADHGKLELEDGDIITLKKNSRHFLPTSECQTLIRQGILKQIL